MVFFPMMVSSQSTHWFFHSTKHLVMNVVFISFVPETFLHTTSKKGCHSCATTLKNYIFLLSTLILASKDRSQWKDYLTGLIKYTKSVLFPKWTTPLSTLSTKNKDMTYVNQCCFLLIINPFKKGNIFSHVP